MRSMTGYGRSTKELDGRTLREDLVEAIFSRFCVGK